MEFRILGPVEVECDGDRLTITRAKERALLAMLLLHGGSVVSADSLIQGLWGVDPPATAATALQGHVSRLRRLLGAHRILTQHPGYRFVLGDDRLDLRRFERLLSQARGAQDPRRRAALLRQALELWRGDALVDVRDEPFASAAIARLEHMRISAIEDRIDAELASGRHRQVISDLVQLVARHPLREHLQGQLMLALYRSGRQAEALETYRAARDRLADDLGVEPTPELRRLHLRILHHDHALDLTGQPPDSRSQLPMPVSSFIGREAERDALGTLLVRPDVRLVTLTGPGGTGKTRLALEAARAVAGEFTHGAVFVDLATVNDPELVPSVIAHTLKVDEVPGQSVADSLGSHLADRHLLLLLDNFEHLLGGSVLVIDLLETAPDLTVMVTSREALRLTGEHRFPVPRLALPGEDIATAAEIADNEAVRLFVLRSRAVDPQFSVTDGVAPVLARIAIRLDGLPLALELAAAHSDRLAPEQLLGQLDARRDLLVDGPRDRPSRHQTLRAALDWSVELLPVEEQEVFARLGIFAGGWTTEAATAVCGGSDSVLASLSAKSLIEPAGPGDRFRMLQTVRDHALGRLRPAEAARLHARHADYYIELAVQADMELSGPDLAVWLDRLEAEHDNFRTALAWARQADDGARQLRLAAALARFWGMRGHLTEGRRWLERSLESAAEQPLSLHADALSGAALIAFRQGDYDRTSELCSRRLQLAALLKDRRAQAETLDLLGTVASNAGDHELGMRRYAESAALFRELDDRSGLARSLTNMGSLGLMLGDLDRARQLTEEGLQLHRELENPGGTVVPLFNLGIVALEQGELDLSDRHLRESLRTAANLGMREDVVYALEGFAAVAAARRHPQRAVRLLGAAEALAEEIGLSLEPFELALHDRTLAAIRDQSAPADIERNWVHGRGLRLDDAVDVALASADD